jgi:hypothetical protein
MRVSDYARTISRGNSGNDPFWYEYGQTVGEGFGETQHVPSNPHFWYNPTTAGSA